MALGSGSMNSDTRMPADFSSLNDRLEHGVGSADVETAFGRALFAAFRHEAARVRHVAQGDRQHFLGRSHLEIQGPRQLGLQARDVGIGDVAAVLAQMRGNAVGARLYGDVCGAQRIRMPAAPRVPDRSDVIDVDAKAQYLDLTSGFSHSKTRSTLLTTALDFSPATMLFKCTRSQTSSPMRNSVKSEARRSILRLSMLPPAWPMTSAIWASVPGRLGAVTDDESRKPLGILRIDVPGDVDPAFVLVLLKARRMDLENADALAGRHHADDAIARHRAAVVEADGQIVLDAADVRCRCRSWHCAIVRVGAELEALHRRLEAEPAILTAGTAEAPVRGVGAAPPQEVVPRALRKHGGYRPRQP